MMLSGTRKPTSRFGPKDDNGFYRWEHGYLYWPDIRLLVTKKNNRLKESSGINDYTCPKTAVFNANLMLVCLDPWVDFEDEASFFTYRAWPRTFEVAKSRFDNRVGQREIMSMIDFRLMLIR